VPGRLMRRAIDEGAATVEGFRLRKDGSRFWASVVLTALHDKSGRLRGFAKVTRDITEQKHAEQSMAILAESSRLLAQSLDSEQKEAAFKLVTAVHDNRDNADIFTFENPQHDFPQRIIYRRGTEGWLYATIEGKLQGQDRQVTYPYRRIDCECAHAQAVERACRPPRAGQRGQRRPPCQRDQEREPDQRPGPPPGIGPAPEPQRGAHSARAASLAHVPSLAPRGCASQGVTTPVGRVVTRQRRVRSLSDDATHA